MRRIFLSQRLNVTRPFPFSSCLASRVSLPRSISWFSTSSFQSLKLPLWLCHKLVPLKIQNPTPIQTAAIPHLRRPWPKAPISDVILQDVTGSGKTLAYLLPIVSELDNFNNGVQAIIIVPSTQLAHQVTLVAEQLTGGGKNRRKDFPVRVATLYGDINPNMIQELKETEDQQPHIVIGTPETIAQVANRNLLRITWLKHIVLDEIDHLVNSLTHSQFLLPIIHLRQPSQLEAQESKDKQSFLDKKTHQLEVSKTVGEEMNDDWEKTRPNKPGDYKTGQRQLRANDGLGTQIVLVSATALIDSVKDFAKKNLKQPYLIVDVNGTQISDKKQAESYSESTKVSERQLRKRVTKASLPAQIKHQYVICQGSRMKLFPELINAVYRDWKVRNSKRDPDKKLARPAFLVFFNEWDIPQTRQFAYLLRKTDLKVGLLSENSSRAERREALHPNVDVILTTDLFSRGMDFRHLSHVINYHIPKRINLYIHRAGRVGRLGSVHAHRGHVITLVPSHQQDAMNRFAKSLELSITPIRLDAKGLHEEHRSNSRSNERKHDENSSAKKDQEIHHKAAHLRDSEGPSDIS